MAYKVIDLFKDLPKRPGCSDCGRPGCFAFATAVHLEGLDVGACPHLDESSLAEIRTKLGESGGPQVGEREEPEEEAARELQASLADADLRSMAEKAAVDYVEGPPEGLEVKLFDRPFRIERERIVALDGQDFDVWMKVMLLLYVTRASGAPLVGEWVAYRDLPNTISKQKTFEKWINRIATTWAGRFDELAAAAEAMGGKRVEDPSADLALRFTALPRVPLHLALWDADEDFEARASLLLDRGVLDYLDQEALTLLAEELMRRLQPAQ